MCMECYWNDADRGIPKYSDIIISQRHFLNYKLTYTTSRSNSGSPRWTAGRRFGSVRCQKSDDHYTQNRDAQHTDLSTLNIDYSQSRDSISIYKFHFDKQQKDTSHATPPLPRPTSESPPGEEMKYDDMASVTLTHMYIYIYMYI